MSESALLRASDYRALTQLSHECRDLGDDPIRWRMHLAGGLAPLTGTGLVMMVEGYWAADGSSQQASGCVWGWENGFDEASGRALIARLNGDSYYNPMLAPYLADMAREDGVCRSRADLVSDGRWYRSPYFEEHSAVGCDAILYCYRQTDGGLLSGLLLIRPTREPDFSARVKGIVQETHALIAPLIGGPLARFGEPSPADLPPRVRQVLRCLLEGDSDKQIAARLGLSRFTVNEYTKRAYRHFGTAGRTELIARWVSRGWGNRFAWDDAQDHT